MSPYSLKTTDSSQDLEFRSIWEELYNPKDPDCPVRLAIRITAWQHRPNHIWKQDFEGALPGRMYQKLRANFYNAKKSGVPPHVWRTKIGMLTRTAESAAKDERNYIIEGARSKYKPTFDQLDTSDLPAISEFNTANSNEPDNPTPSSEPDNTAPLSEPDNPTPALSTQCNLLASGDSHDPYDFVRRFVIEGFQSPTFHTDLEHIRSCDSCLNLFQKVAAEFAKLSDLQAVDRECACLLRKLGMWRNATELLLAVLDIIEQQLVLLGYSNPGRQAKNGNPTMWLVVPDSAEERQQIIRGTMREGLAIAYNLRSLGYRGPLRRPLPASSRTMSNRNTRAVKFSKLLDDTLTLALIVERDAEIMISNDLIGIHSPTEGLAKIAVTRLAANRKRFEELLQCFARLGKLHETTPEAIESWRTFFSGPGSTIAIGPSNSPLIWTLAACRK